MMDRKRLLNMIKNREPSIDTIGMILSNNVDFGHPNGALVSVKKFDDVSKDIIDYFKAYYGDRAWIKVEDRQPETSNLVLCCNKNHGRFLAFYKDGRWSDVLGLQRDPTHWQPMPEGPVEQAFAEKLASDQIETPDDIAELITKNFKDLI